MVTEGVPVGCESCFDHDHLRIRRHSTTSPSFSLSEGLPDISRAGGRTGSSSSEKDKAASRSALQNQDVQATSPAIETPPGSPRVTTLQSTQKANVHKRDSSFRKTYNETDKRRAIPCENCALTLPRKMKAQSPGGSGKNGGFDNSSPILRTRIAYERVALPADRASHPSPPRSNSSDSSDSEKAITSKPRRHSRGLSRTGTSSSNSSFTSTTPHDHNIDYISTHEPLAPTSFSIVRQSCLRTLSCETLPPSSSQPITSSPSSPLLSNPFSSGPSTPSTSSGGPIFFGDPQAGYTTAYIFRIPDPSARGRRRVYALMALSTHRERLAMKTFSFLSAAFRELAQWITDLAQQELERSHNNISAGIPSPRPDANSSTTSQSSSLFSTNSLNYPASSAVYNNTPTSSFLSAGRSRDPDGRFASAMGVRARGLAELVGLPDFFFELHKRFVMLLVELGVLLAT